MKLRLAVLIGLVVAIAFVIGLAVGMRRSGRVEESKRPEPAVEQKPAPEEPIKEHIRFRDRPRVEGDALDGVVEALRSGDSEKIRKAIDDLMARLKPEAVADADNAAPLYRAAFKAYAQGPANLTAALSKGAELTPDQIETARAWLKGNRKALELLHQGAERSRCNFDLDVSKGVPSSLLKDLLDGLRLLRAEALLAEGDAAAQTARASCRLADAIADEPFLGAQFLQATSYGIVSLTFGAALDKVEGEEALREMMGALSPEKVRAGFVKALMRDLGLAARFVVEPDGERALPPVDDPSRTRLLADYAEALADYSRLAGRPWCEVRDELDMMESTKKAGTPLLDRLAEGTLPTFVVAAESQSKAEALIGTARLGTALKLYRRQRGQYPSSLDDLRSLLPSAPIDPFSGQPYRYRREGDGFVVYSLGPNGRDDGGSSPDTDVVLRLGR